MNDPPIDILLGNTSGGLLVFDHDWRSIYCLSIQHSENNWLSGTDKTAGPAHDFFTFLIRIYVSESASS